MTDSNSQVSDGTVNEGLPTPTFTETSASSPSANVDDALVSKIVERLTPVLDEKISRVVQSQKDKRISKIEKALGGRLEVLDELAESGVQIPEGLKLEYRLRELEASKSSQAQPDPGRSGQAPTDVVSDALSELKKHGLDSNDPQVIEMLRGHYPNPDAFRAQIRGYILEKKTPPNPPSPAGVVQSPATSSRPPEDVSVKIARLAEMQKTPTKYRGEIDKLVRELDDLKWGG